MLLGCIGDDFTGSSDLGNTLVKQGMRTVQYVGVPKDDAAPEVEAGVVALKSRSIPAAEAVKLSLEALEWLKAQGCEQFLFKYCSTFDSTPEGNIGPVAEALADALGTRSVIFCPAFPATGRTIYQGHLFVQDHLLSESGMENHPLTPMTDPDLRRVLAAQVSRGVGHVPASTVWQGPEAIRARLASETEADRGFVIADAIRDEDLLTWGKALKGTTLLTGGSGIALGLPGNFALSGKAGAWTGQGGRAVALSGSCSNATRAQVAAHEGPKREVTAEEALGGLSADTLADWALAQDGLPLIYSSAEPATVAEAQRRHGREKVAAALEGLFARTAAALAAKGVKRIISAGGETSGAVVEALAPEALEIGPEIDPGVPVMRAGEMVLALKSGNFGAVDFFAKAARVMEQGA
ncbi:3-oxo-tetronate kinase [Salipiger mangrovisoli]|uniref:3-oxo-tetronate kinase n=1 Tax=Salipiger mangrovisoli TaxID=2865933 RepID=A0ABR9WYX8_9RHOB|nr:3-oxo-tetronate kinase [Salipiger mangrovisoli]MBE9636499.1 four-carbon acid sugar kinase family protein [Salipiger mangrovisoli]